MKELRVFVTNIEDVVQFSESAEQYAMCDYLIDYSFFVDSLRKHGARIESLTWKDYDSLLSNRTSAYDLLEKHFKADLIVHNRTLFRESLDFILKENGITASKEIIKDKERTINRILYQCVPAKCHGITPPQTARNQDFRLKDNLPEILGRLDVPTPKLVSGDEFPFYLKHKCSSRGRDVYLVKNNRDLTKALVRIAHLKQDLDNFLIQEAIQSPTKMPSTFRVISYGKEVIGGAIYYATDSGCSAVVLEGRTNALKQEEQDLLQAYKLTRRKLPSHIKEYSQRIGDYAAAHGTKLVGTDFVVNAQGTAYCVDINRDPGLEFFAFRDSLSDIGLVKKSAGNAFAKAAFKKSSGKKQHSDCLKVI